MSVDYQMVFGQNVLRLRKSLGLSQAALAAKIDKDRSYIGLLERGERNPSLGTIVRIAESLDVAPHDLLRKESNNEPQ